MKMSTCILLPKIDDRMEQYAHAVEVSTHTHAHTHSPESTADLSLHEGVN